MDSQINQTVLLLREHHIFLRQTFSKHIFLRVKSVQMVVQGEIGERDRGRETESV